MKICVLAPSTRYRTSAGARIRYGRLEKLLTALGHSITIQPIEQIHSKSTFSADVYLLSKCYDTRGLAVARLLKTRGKIVGVDFFDDQFSQALDARLANHRAWLVAARPLATFALSSTPTMRDVIQTHWPETPIHVLNDPFERLDIRDLSRAMEEKLEATESTGSLKVAWFGQGDNNLFPVGLRDLTAFGSALGVLATAFRVELRILTNPRSLTADGLERLGTLPVPFVVEEWSQTAESQLLTESLVTFLPVNSQPFSAAKSLNRCVSALTHGSQVLSVGHPLYAPFDSLIYRSPERLVDDIKRRALALRRQTAPLLAALMTELGDPAVEAARLVAFLAGVRVALNSDDAPANEPDAPLIVLHGLDSPNDTHRSIQKLGHISMAGPFSRSGPTYDVAFSSDRLKVGAEISFQALERIACGLSERAKIVPGLQEPRFWLDLSGLVTEETARQASASQNHTSYATTLAEYETRMMAARTVCRLLFGNAEIVVSEHDPGLQPMARSLEAAVVT